MRCQRCQGTGRLVPEFYTQPACCPDCNGSGIEACCEGEQACKEIEGEKDNAV